MTPQPAPLWTPKSVVDVDGPAALCRTYWEHRDLRAMLEPVIGATRIGTAIDLGCGFGRNCLLLDEFATLTIGLERERGLLAIARALVPGAAFVSIGSLARLPVRDGAADLTLVFTVLQHLPDDALKSAVAEAQRITRPEGHILIVEETDEGLEAGSAAQPEHGYTRGRSASRYAQLFAPRPLLATRARRIEPTYARPNVGSYLLFGAFGAR
jgi:SAM-dependent methyltransferase